MDIGAIYRPNSVDRDAMDASGASTSKLLLFYFWYDIDRRDSGDTDQIK